MVQRGIGWSGSKVVKARGSGITDRRPKFLALLADPKISQIVVQHKDRASRLGSPTCKPCWRGLGRELVVVNTADTAENDLMAALQQNGSSCEPE